MIRIHPVESREESESNQYSGSMICLHCSAQPESLDISRVFYREAINI